MNKGKFIGGMSMGLVVGAAIGASVAKKKKKMGKGAVGKAMKTISSAVEDVVSTLGL